MTQLRISAKSLGTISLSEFCPRCFWPRLKTGNKLPFQIFPGIFSSIDVYTKIRGQVAFGNGRLRLLLF